MISNELYRGRGTYMKKSAVFVLVLSLVILFAATATAFAAATSDYATWVSGGDNGATPHKGYGTTTVKCAVCHAVHKATSSGEILLENTAANACVYCHITTTTGTKVLYGGTVNNYYTGSGDLNTAHNNAGAVPVGCTECHSVHGADTIGGAASSKILRSGGGQPRILAAGYDPDSATRDEQISVFCTSCHPYFVGSYEQTVAPTVGYGTGSFQSHIMIASGSAYGNPHASTNVVVAFAGSRYCRSCHDAGVINGASGYETNSFPHYTAGAARFLTGAASSAVGTSAVANPQSDAVCLKCHYNGTIGVGETF
jgi:predicted CXXCH cytochrome family protein